VDKEKGSAASAFCGLQTSTQHPCCSPWSKGPSQHLRPTIHIRKTFEQAIAKTTEDDAISLTEFRKNYIRHTTENIHHAWQELIANNMRGVWKSILLHWENTSDFDEEIVIEEITNIGRELGTDGIENDCVRELLNSHSQALTDDDLLFDQQRAFEEADNDTEE
jgi:hypothetical protein